MSKYDVILPHSNVQAFLALLRHTEGAGYTTLFGGGQFTDYSDHPRKLITRKLGSRDITSSAAGAYQFLARTWDECVVALGLKDFSPASQDRAALFLIDRRKALEAVIAGDWPVAISLCNKEWASLPGSPYGQPTKGIKECLAFLDKMQEGVWIGKKAAEVVVEKPVVIEQPKQVEVPMPEAPPQRETVGYLELMRRFFQTFQAGKELANAAKWKQHQVDVNSLALFGVGVMQIARGLGYEINLDDEGVRNIAAGLLAFIGLFNIGATVTTTKKIGLRGVSGAGGADNGTQSDVYGNPEPLDADVFNARSRS